MLLGIGILKCALKLLLCTFHLSTGVNNSLCFPYHLKETGTSNYAPGITIELKCSGLERFADQVVREDVASCYPQGYTQVIHRTCGQLGNASSKTDF